MVHLEMLCEVEIKQLMHMELVDMTCTFTFTICVNDADWIDLGLYCFR